MTSEKAKAYQELQVEWRALHDRMSILGGKMQMLWMSLTREERNEVDPEGAPYRGRETKEKR
jgi:hypothetical protein